MNKMTRNEAFETFLRQGRSWYRTERAAQDYARAMILAWEQGQR
jgi:hypothetical protein